MPSIVDVFKVLDAKNWRCEGLTSLLESDPSGIV